MKDDNNITNGELAKLIESAVEELVGRIYVVKNELSERIGKQGLETRSELKELRAGMFTPEEKETLLNMVDHINERLENDALGKGDITLTRPEYDATAVAANFLNRFKSPREAWAE